MDQSLFETTKLASYFMWEQTNVDNALNLWYCAEDMACFMECSGITEMGKLLAIMSLDKNDPGYVHFIRHMAFRLFVYTEKYDAETNWYNAEHLLHNIEWRNAIIHMAYLYHTGRGNTDFINDVKSTHVRSFYSK